MGYQGKKKTNAYTHTAMIALFRKNKNTITCSFALAGSVGEILADANVEILIVFEGNILVVSVALLGNIAVTFVINVVATAVGCICVDFDSVMLVDKTTKIKIGSYNEWSKKIVMQTCNKKIKKNYHFLFSQWLKALSQF